MSDSYQITAPVQFSNNTVGSNLGQIQISGALLDKNHFIWSRNSNAIAINSNTTTTNYTLYYPNTAPNLYQAMLTTANGNVFTWYDLEAPGTLVVRSNPAPGQFSNLESAVQSISNFSTPKTIWVQSDIITSSNANAILTIPPSVTIKGFGPSSRLVDYQLSFVSSNANDLASGIQDVMMQRSTMINTNYAISTLESNGTHSFNRITFSDYENWFQFVNQTNNSSANVNVVSVISDSFTNTLPRVISNLVYSTNSGPNVSIFDLVANTDSTTTTSPFIISGPSNTSNKTKLIVQNSVLATNSGTTSNSNFVVNVSSVDTLKLSSDYFFNYGNIIVANACNANTIALENITSPFANTTLKLTNSNVTNTITYRGMTNLNSFDTDSEQILVDYVLLDRAKNRGIREFSFFDDFTGNAAPYSDTTWFTAGTTSNIRNSIPFAQHVNGALCLAMDTFVVQNYVLYKSPAPFLNGSFLKFFCNAGTFGYLAPVPTGDSMGVIGLGDNVNVFTGTNANAVFQNGMWFSWTRVNPSINEVRFHWGTNGVIASNFVSTLVQNWATVEFDYIKDPEPRAYIYLNVAQSAVRALAFSTNSNLLPPPNITTLRPIIKYFGQAGANGCFSTDYVGYYCRSNFKRSS